MGKSYFDDLMIHCEKIAQKMAKYYYNDENINLNSNINGRETDDPLFTLLKLQVTFCLIFESLL